MLYSILDSYDNADEVAIIADRLIPTRTRLELHFDGEN